jgi:hypothetical protein
MPQSGLGLGLVKVLTLVESFKLISQEIGEIAARQRGKVLLLVLISLREIIRRVIFL